MAYLFLLVPLSPEVVFTLSSLLQSCKQLDWVHTRNGHGFSATPLEPRQVRLQMTCQWFGKICSPSPWHAPSRALFISEMSGNQGTSCRTRENLRRDRFPNTESVIAEQLYQPHNLILLPVTTQIQRLDQSNLPLCSPRSTSSRHGMLSDPRFFVFSHVSQSRTKGNKVRP